MPKSMLDPIVRAMISVPEKHHGFVLDIVNKLGGQDADDVRKRLGKALREPSTPPLDTIIRIDRAAAVPYPNWVKDVLNPAIERNAPAEYDLAKLELWLHGGQKGGSVTGNRIYEHLQNNKMLDNCLSLSDGLAIQQKGVAAFRKVFGNNYVFLWGSVVRRRDGNLFVPCVFVGGGEVVVSWGWLAHGWNSGGPAARFAS